MFPENTEILVTFSYQLTGRKPLNKSKREIFYHFKHYTYFCFKSGSHTMLILDAMQNFKTKLGCKAKYISSCIICDFKKS